jgi:MFS family permease
VEEVNQLSLEQLNPHIDKEEEISLIEQEKSVIKNFSQGLIDVMRNPVQRYATLAASLRISANYVSDFFIPAWYFSTYSQYQSEYSVLQSLAFILAAVSGYAGGIIADKYGDKDSGIFAKVCYWGTGISIPFMFFSLLVTNNFPLSMVLTGARYLINESFWSPNVVML